MGRISAIVARPGLNGRLRHPRAEHAGRRWGCVLRSAAIGAGRLRLGDAFRLASPTFFHQLSNVVANARPHGGQSIERVSTRKSQSMRVFFHASGFAGPSLLMTSHVA